MFAALRGRQRVIEDALGLQHPRARRGFTRSGVPQRPCRDVDQCVGHERLDIDVIGVCVREARHGIGVAGVAGDQRVGVVRVVGGEAGLQRLDQPAFERGSPRSARQLEF